MTPPKPKLRDVITRYYYNLEADIKGVWFCLIIMGVVNLLAIFFVIEQNRQILKILKEPKLEETVRNDRHPR